MSEVFGIDLQHSRSMIALAERGEVSAPPRSVGDGRRQLVPNAHGPKAHWGTISAEMRLVELDTTSPDLADQLLSWRRDPTDEPFLQGMVKRLYDYLGHLHPTTRHGYQVCVTGERLCGEIRVRCRTVGLPGVAVVDPADALITRWLSEPTVPAAFDGTVVAVVCGETTTVVMPYRVERSKAGTRIEVPSGTAQTMDIGAGAVSIELARAVLGRCKEGVPAGLLIALLDATWEFAASLRSRPRTEELEWDGVLAERMFAPVRLSRDSIAQWPVASRVASATASAVDRAVAGLRLGGPPLVLVGGLGAVWPFFADAVREVGPIWQSGAPEFDLASGAAAWPGARGRFVAGTSRIHPPAAQGPTACEEPPEPADVREERDGSDDVPPWERDY